MRTFSKKPTLRFTVSRRKAGTDICFTVTIANDGYEKLRDAIDAGNLDEAFERAHALKGMLGNVSLTNLLDPVTEMVEELRLRHDIDYSPMLERLFTELDRLRSL